MKAFTLEIYVGTVNDPAYPNTLSNLEFFQSIDDMPPPNPGDHIAGEHYITQRGYRARVVFASHDYKRCVISIYCANNAKT